MLPLLLLAATFTAGAEATPVDGRPDVFVYHVMLTDGPRDVVSLLPPSRMRDGLPAAAIVGTLKVPIAQGGEVTGDNVIENPAAVRFLHEFIARTAPTLEGAIAAARDMHARGDRYLNYVDARTPPDAPQEQWDWIGSFEIADGRISAQAWRSNRGHRLVSGLGVFRLDRQMHALYVDALAALPLDDAARD